MNKHHKAHMARAAKRTRADKPKRGEIEHAHIIRVHGQLTLARIMRRATRWINANPGKQPKGHIANKVRIAMAAAQYMKDHMEKTQKTRAATAT